MAVRRERKYDVWFLASETVYKNVPYGTLTDWAEQGRVGASDKVRLAGTEKWGSAGSEPLIADFLLHHGRAGSSLGEDTPESLAEIDLGRDAPLHHEEEDDDVDMIPLIDISLVLLIFFMMTSAVASMSPVPVPELKNTGELSADVHAITVVIAKKATGEVALSLSIGEKTHPDDDNLRTIEEAMRRLDDRLRTTSKPPEVRIACDKVLERSWVKDVAHELNKRKNKDQIASFTAEVNEAKK